MGSDNDTAAAQFGERLRALMLSRGRVSETARSGVDVAALAAAGGTSYEMARRYAEGQALPRPGTLRRIATWLGVSAASLAWGDGAAAGASTVDQEVLQVCVQAVIEAQRVSNRSLSPEKTAALVAALYQDAVEGHLPGVASVARMISAIG